MLKNFLPFHLTFSIFLAKLKEIIVLMLKITILQSQKTYMLPNIEILNKFFLCIKLKDLKFWFRFLLISYLLKQYLNLSIKRKLLCIFSNFIDVKYNYTELVNRAVIKWEKIIFFASLMYNQHTCILKLIIKQKINKNEKMLLSL